MVIGGLEIKEQRKKLLVARPNVIIGTPGRIKDIINKEWVSLKDLKVLIVDEADKFCQSSKFKAKKQKVTFFDDLKFIVDQNPHAQIAAFSATYNNESLRKI